LSGGGGQGRGAGRARRGRGKRVGPPARGAAHDVSPNLERGARTGEGRYEGGGEVTEYEGNPAPRQQHTPTARSPSHASHPHTGPAAVKLFVSSSTKDADLFVVLRVFGGDLKEVVFQGAIDPHTPVGQGWLRASHRKLDKKLSMPYRPYHSHDKVEPLKPAQVVGLDIEI